MVADASAAITGARPIASNPARTTTLPSFSGAPDGGPIEPPVEGASATSAGKMSGAPASGVEANGLGLSPPGHAPIAVSICWYEFCVGWHKPSTVRSIWLSNPLQSVV